MTPAQLDALLVEPMARATENIILVYRIYSKTDAGYHVLDKTWPEPEDVVGTVLWRDGTPSRFYHEHGLDRPPFDAAQALRHFRSCAAIAAMRATLTAKGLFIGPKVATPGMKRALAERNKRLGDGTLSEAFFGDVWTDLRIEWQRGGGA